MDTKTISLTLAERLAALRLFDAFKGSISDLALIIEDVKAIAVKEDEWTAANLNKTPNADGSVTWNWTDEGTDKEFTLANSSVEYLKSTIDTKSEAGEFSIADKAIVTLAAKLA